MAITPGQEEIIEKFKEEEICFTFSDYFSENEIKYTIDERDHGDASIGLIIEFSMSHEDKYQLEFRVFDDYIEMHLDEEQYEEASAENMWKLLFFQASAKIK